MSIDTRTADRIDRALSEINAVFGNGLVCRWQQFPSGRFAFGAAPVSAKAKEAMEWRDGVEFVSLAQADTIEDVASVLFGTGLLASMIERGYVDLAYLKVPR